MEEPNFGLVLASLDQLVHKYMVRAKAEDL